MKTRILLTILTLSVFSLSIFAQGITNDGATIVIENGTTVTVTNGGGYYNMTNGSNHGKIDLDGTLQITGDFVNDVTDADEHVFITPGSNGTVVFAGTGDQNITNTLANAYIDFEGVTVNTGSITLLAAGSAATMNGPLLVNSGGTFRLSSPGDGEGPSGSLITNASVSGAGALYVDRHFETAGKYVYFSVPVSNADDNDFDNTLLPNNFNPNLYSYTESYDAGNVNDPLTDPDGSEYSNWSDPLYAFYNAWNQVADEVLTIPLVSGEGYITYNEIELDIEFGGSPSDLNNLSSYSPTATYTDNDDGNGFGSFYDGWNIVGNPYPCALDWDDVNWTRTNVTNTIYMWDGDAAPSGNYVYYNNNDGSETLGDGQSANESADARYIPAMQAFYIKASASPTFTIPDQARVHYQKDMYKGNENNDDENDYNFDYLKLKTEKDGFSDETIVRFFENATPYVDDAYDAYKMFPTNAPALLYSIALFPEIPVAINSLPISDLGTTIPLGFYSANSGTFNISAEEFQFEVGTDVKFIDTYMENEEFVDEDFEYTFTYNGEESRDRFYLFVAPVGVDIEDPIDNDHDTDVNIWSSENKVFITISSYDLIDAKVEIVDVLGKSILQKRLLGTYNIIDVPGASGTYIVKLRTKNGQNHLNKVFIHK